jgi:hypothetical protein
MNEVSNCMALFQNDLILCGGKSSFLFPPPDGVEFVHEAGS